jgi:hypothetical protein
MRMSGGRPLFFLFSWKWLPCVICMCHTEKGSDCRALPTVAHGKGRLLPCVLDYSARQRPVIAGCFFLRRTAKDVTRRLAPAPSVAFFLTCAFPWCTANIVHRALSDPAQGNETLPCKMLPCALCRTPRRKTHGKVFAVRFRAFAVRFRAFVVRPRRTANPLFPIVCGTMSADLRGATSAMRE